MEGVEYKLIVSIPAVLVALGSFIVLFAVIVCKRRSALGTIWKVLDAGKFPSTIHYLCSSRAKLTVVEEQGHLKTLILQMIRQALPRLCVAFCICFFLLFGGVTTLLFQFLLLDISFNLPTHTDWLAWIYAFSPWSEMRSRRFGIILSPLLSRKKDNGRVSCLNTLHAFSPWSSRFPMSIWFQVAL